MNKIFVSLLLLWCGGICLQAQEVFKNSELAISKLKADTWVVETTDMTTMYIVEGEKRAMLIDTGTKCTGLDQVVRKITDKPLDVLITHLHPDHAGNIRYFDSIYMHPADTVMLGEYQYKGKINFVADRQVFDLGGIEIEVAHMPGHTPGSIVLLNRATGDCFSGDAFGSGQVWLQLEPHVPMENYVESCERMERLMENEGIRYIWCGHYPYTKSAYDLSYIKQMKKLGLRLCQGDEKGSQPFPMPPSLHAKGRTMMLREGYVIIVYNADKINAARSGVCAYAQTPILKVEGGQIEGVADARHQLSVYKGIPYAAPPVGPLRWKKPQPVVPWQGVRACKEFGAASLQADHTKGSFYWKEFYQAGNPQRSEDCLYLNVWTPAAGTSARLPVVVWIHGGGYLAGYGHETEFDGTAFAQKGVILVTLNYRLGMCGFLSHPQLTAENGGKGSGNYGLFDQLAALRWVKQNIAAFGGNPDNVTVMGQSAGAGSVQTLVSSPLSEGYIHKAIIQSGGGLGGIIQARSLPEAEAAGKEMWGDLTVEDMRACPAEKFGEVLKSYFVKQQKMQGLPFYPCVDGELLTAPLTDAALNGQALDIPYLIGYTSEDIAPQVMRQAAVDWSLLLEKQGRKPAYVYCFKRDLPGEDMAPSPLMGGFGDMRGAFHSAELWYVFGTLDRCWRPMAAADYRLSERMISYWTNFAKNGHPNGDRLEAWKPCTKTDNHIQQLDVEP